MRWLAARKPLPSVITHHVGEAAFLWTLRERAVRSSRHGLASIRALDQRLAANLAAIEHAGMTSTTICDESLDASHAGDAFVLAYVATVRRDPDRIEDCVRGAEKSDVALSEIASGIAWAPSDDAAAVIDQIGVQPIPVCQQLMLKAMAAAGHDPGPILGRLLDVADSASRIAAIDAAAQLGRRDLTQRISLLTKDPPCAVPAALALLRMGGPGVARTARALLESSEGWSSEESAAIVARALPVHEAWEWHGQLAAGEPGVSARIAVAVAAGCGEIRAVDWLVSRTRDRGLARVAADALQLIGGIRIDEDHLSAPEPETATDDAGDAPAGDDPDFDLPWPDSAAIERWWQRTRTGLAPGTRYLAGRATVDTQALGAILADGDQRQRSAAAQELVFQGKAPPPIFDTGAPSDRQTSELVTMRSNRERR